jgi:hypothetical protein
MLKYITSLCLTVAVAVAIIGSPVPNSAGTHITTMNNGMGT